MYIRHNSLQLNMQKKLWSSLRKEEDRFIRKKPDKYRTPTAYCVYYKQKKHCNKDIYTQVWREEDLDCTDMRNTTVATCESVAAYPSGAPEIEPQFLEGFVSLSLSFLCCGLCAIVCWSFSVLAMLLSVYFRLVSLIARLSVRHMFLFTW